MSRIRLIMLSVLAAIAGSAVASASASASECPDTVKGNDYAVCVGSKTEALKEATPTLSNEETQGVVTVFRGKALGAKVKIECTNALFKNKVEDGAGENSGTSTGEITFKTCKVLEPLNGASEETCVVAEPIVANFTDLLSQPPAAITDTFTGSPGGEFVKLEFSNKTGKTCVLNGQKIAVTGSQVVTFDAAIGTPNEDHTVTASVGGSNLKFGGGTATFEGVFPNVETGVQGQEWAIKES